MILSLMKLLLPKGFRTKDFALIYFRNQCPNCHKTLEIDATKQDQPIIACRSCDQRWLIMDEVLKRKLLIKLRARKCVTFSDSKENI